MKISINKTKSVIIAAYFILLPAFCACSGDDPEGDKLSVDKSEIVFKAGVNTQTFNVTADKEWYIEADGLEKGFGTTVGIADWYIVDKTFGSGSSEIKIDLKENQSTQGDHVATLTIIGKNNRLDVILKQEKGSE